MTAKLQLEIASQIILTMRIIDGSDSVIEMKIIQLLIQMILKIQVQVLA